MGIWIAEKTLAAIDAAICADEGNAFKKFQGIVLPQMTDAYKEEEDSYRTHLGASVIGGKCERAVFYGWKWAHKSSPRGKKNEPAAKAESRMRRLWNRGHLEEGRLISLMLCIGVTIYQQDDNGKQYRISALGGHFGGAGDGIAVGIPDLPAGVPALTEYKTHSDKSFQDLVADGVKESKPEHYAQMQEYMHHMGLLYAVYVAVNKNTEELHAEIILYDRPVAEHFLERARRIIFDDAMPARIRGASPGFMQCKYMCDYTDVCFKTVEPDRNCRTCQYGYAMPDGTWQCLNPTVLDVAAASGWDDVITLDKAAQLAGCEHYALGSIFK